MHYTITGFERKGTCERTSKEGEVVTVDSPDEDITNACLSFKALEEMIRFRHFQEQKKIGNDSSGNRSASEGVASSTSKK